MRGVEVLVDQRGQVKRHSLFHRQVPSVMSVKKTLDEWAVLVSNISIEEDAEDAQVSSIIGMNDVEFAIVEYSIDRVL